MGGGCRCFDTQRTGYQCCQVGRAVLIRLGTEERAGEGRRTTDL